MKKIKFTFLAVVIIGLIGWWMGRGHQPQILGKPIDSSTSASNASMPESQRDGSTAMVANEAGSLSIANPRPVDDAPRPPANEADWQRFLGGFDSENPWRLSSTPTGRVIAVGGGFARLPQNGVKDAFEWAQKIAGLSGVPAEQIRNSGEELQETDFSRTMHFPQSYSGFDVAGGFVRVFLRKEDGAIYYTSLELQPIGQPNVKINVARNQAEDLGKRYFASFESILLLSSDKNPQIVPLAGARGELAWRIVYRIAGPGADERELYISTVSGAVLKDTPVLLD